MRQLSPTIRPPCCQQSLSRSVVEWISLSQHLSVFVSFPFPLSPPSFLWHLHSLLSPTLSGSDSLIAKLKMVLILSGFLSLIWTHSLQLFFFFFFPLLQLIQFLRQICWLSLVSACCCRMRSPRSSSSARLCSRRLCSCSPSWRSMTGMFFLSSLPSSLGTRISSAHWG